MNILLVFLLTVSCKQSDNNISNKPSIVDTSKYSIIQFSNSGDWFFKDAKPSNLTTAEIQNAEAVLLKCIENYNSEQQKQFDKISKEHPEYNLKLQDFIIDLKKYKRQYVPVLTKKGQKEVWINFFCETSNKNWRKEIIHVDDGGNCYFNVIINLTTKTYHELMVNGVA